MQYFTLSKELYEVYPTNISFKNGLAISYWKLGDLYRSQQNTEQALDFFEKAQQLWQELTQQAPAYPMFKNYLDRVTTDLAGLSALS